jgi:hypothetical protein
VRGWTRGTDPHSAAAVRCAVCGVSLLDEAFGFAGRWLTGLSELTARHGRCVSHQCPTGASGCSTDRLGIGGTTPVSGGVSTLDWRHLIQM